MKRASVWRLEDAGDVERLSLVFYIGLFGTRTREAFRLCGDTWRWADNGRPVGYDVGVRIARLLEAEEDEYQRLKALDAYRYAIGRA